MNNVYRWKKIRKPGRSWKMHKKRNSFISPWTLNSCCGKKTNGKPLPKTFFLKQETSRKMPRKLKIRLKTDAYQVSVARLPDVRASHMTADNRQTAESKKLSSEYLHTD